MGVAWLDENAPPMHAHELRTGGLPLLDDDQEWPECPHCDTPMLFRAQMPLSMTALAAPTDDRIVLVFECHARRQDGPCDAGAVLVAHGEAKPRSAPAARAFDVVVEHSVPDPSGILGVLGALVDDDVEQTELASRIPGIALFGQPQSIAEQARRVLEGAGASAALRPASPIVLEPAHGGILVPFDDGVPGATKTTLPPLSSVSKSIGNRRMRALVAGATPGNRDMQQSCACGRPMRTIMRLLATAPTDAEPLGLEPAIAQICLSCSTGSLHRSTAT